jgi:putative ABC transport system ATP-binding protein
VRPARWRRQVQYLAQQPVMFDGTVWDNLAAGFNSSRAPAPPADLELRAGGLLQELDLDPAAVLGQDARTLSGGEASRVALCRSLLVRPLVLLADEPTAALDGGRAGRLVRLLQRWVGEGGALVLVAHDDAPYEDLERRRLALLGAA